ncbi:HmuY family protein [Longimicrobium terrae]|uniref:HmuY protein n=1 Tax=Longimicrobium terrae TaxID=1639882 RepID=A0A841GVU4_9BACT|nr:hypothetical protein [Longimicrobium terrae]MBB6069958.1 hypothetical protein [Longimicrobium terrae]NNC32869.1 hypothetical protein [Longimicrobium terrae]
MTRSGLRCWSLFSAATLVLMGACSDNGPTEPAVDPGASMTVDASHATNWALVDLGTPAAVVTAADPATSTAWDLAFKATGLMLNGGTAGPGGMTGYCICQNAGATNDQIRAMTPAGEAADFDAVTAAQIPAAASAWSATVFDTSKWYKYNLTGADHQVWPTHDVYLIRRGNEVYKLQVTGYYGPAGETRRISFRYAKLAG